jgi:hypothetical protein
VGRTRRRPGSGGPQNSLVYLLTRSSAAVHARVQQRDGRLRDELLPLLLLLDVDAGVDVTRRAGNAVQQVVGRPALSVGRGGGGLDYGDEKNLLWLFTGRAGSQAETTDANFCKK